MYTKLNLLVVMICLVLSAACAKLKGDKGEQGAAGAPGPTVEAPAAAPAAISSEQAEINAIVSEENAYREGLGQTYLTNGLSCTLYTVTGGQYINSSSITGASQSPTLSGVSTVATFLHADVINQPDSAVSDTLNVLPAALRANPRYTNLIKLICQGQIVVTQTGYYNFELSSDDGSVLYVDGGRLIDNDGNHGTVTKNGSKYLRRGVHAFRLDFAQTGGGSQSLILKANGGLIPGAYLYH